MIVFPKIYTKYRAQKEVQFPDHPYLAQLEQQKERQKIQIQKKYREKINRVERDIVYYQNKVNNEINSEQQHHSFLLLLAIVFDILLNLQLFYSLGFGLGEAILLTIGLSAVQFVLVWFHENTEISIVKQFMKFLLGLLIFGMAIIRFYSIISMANLMGYSFILQLGLFLFTLVFSVGQILMVFWIVQNLKNWSSDRKLKKLLKLLQKKRNLENKLEAKIDETEKFFDELKEFYLYQKRVRQNNNH